MSKQYPVQTVLDLACAAYRINGRYIKELEAVYAVDGQLMCFKQPNRTSVKFTLDAEPWTGDPKSIPDLLKVIPADRTFATRIQTFYRRLIFSAVQGDNDFETQLNSILTTGNVKENQLGYVVCLPTLFKRDYSKYIFEKKLATLDEEYLGNSGDRLWDKDCEIIESSRSKNYDAYNIHAIIDNKMVSWMSKKDLELGDCVVVEARIKEKSKHWRHGNAVTRLNYVKAAQ